MDLGRLPCRHGILVVHRRFHRTPRPQLCRRRDHKTECIRDNSPFRHGSLTGLSDVETITAAWVHWYNTSRLMHRLVRRPPAEAEADYHAQTRNDQPVVHT
jgi:transposase InsO family protein